VAVDVLMSHLNLLNSGMALFYKICKDVMYLRFFVVAAGFCYIFLRLSEIRLVDFLSICLLQELLRLSKLNLKVLFNII